MSEPASGMDCDLIYFPVLADAAEILSIQPVDRLLVVGATVPGDLPIPTSAKRADRQEVALPTGTYRFADTDSWAAMVVLEGGLPGSPASASWEAPDDHPLVNAFAWFDEWWTSASEVPAPVFAPGDTVLVLPDRQEGSVRSRTFEHGEWYYRVRLDGRTQDYRERTLVRPELDDDPEEWIRRTPESAARLAATLTRAKLREDLTDTVYSFRASRTSFRPYQFRPVLRLLGSTRMRLLVADEVGLGKTIEAGLIWTELDARSQANRVLVVCPSMLVGKWRGEMDQRFGYELEELRADGLRELLERAEEDRLPSRLHAVVGVERFRTWDGLERLAELAPRFDLVIVDEAHVFRNSGTRSHALGALLSDWADAMVFLSATPLNLGNDDLFSLLELLAPGEFDDRNVLEHRLAPNAVLNRVSASLVDRQVDSATRFGWLSALDSMLFGPMVTRRPEYAELVEVLRHDRPTAEQVALGRRLVARLHALSAVVTRTRKVEVQEHKAVRAPIPIDVEWTPEEAELYRLLDQWQRERARRLGLPVGFATQMPLRLASTCLPAARDQILARAAGRPLEVVIDDDEDTVVGDDASAGMLLDDRDVPPAEVVDAAKALGDIDTKFERFLEHVLPIVAEGRRVLAFSFSRPTLAYLEQRLQGKLRTAVLHGGIDKNDRPKIIRQFRAGEFDLLLASRVASEGLDFEFCSAVVNYDLPWNPMEVEQRIGRLDRIGQTEERILVLNFHTPGTIETDILERVHQRIGVFTDSIGELEPILRSRLGKLERTLFDFTLTLAERERRVDEMLAAIEEQRNAIDELEQASAFLASADTAEIEGLERDLVTSGRYVGQPELVLLLEEWVSRAHGATCRRSPDGRWLHLKGTAALDADLRLVQSRGERSAAELAALSQALRGEVEVHLCLDQEHARLTGATLLSAIHPFVRAALAASGSGQARHAYVRLERPDLAPGRYLVMVSLARWSGVRSSAELWTSAVALDGGTQEEEVGRALLATLAEASWAEGSPDSAALSPELRAATSDLRRRQSVEEDRRVVENESLLEIRRLSIQETFARKEAVIRRRIETSRSRGSDVAVRLQQSQLAVQSRMRDEAGQELERARRGAMDVEHLAVCVVEVTR